MTFFRAGVRIFRRTTREDAATDLPTNGHQIGTLLSRLQRPGLVQLFQWSLSARTCSNRAYFQLAGFAAVWMTRLFAFVMAAAELFAANEIATIFLAHVHLARAWDFLRASSAEAIQLYLDRTSPTRAYMAELLACMQTARKQFPANIAA